MDEARLAAAMRRGDWCFTADPLSDCFEDGNHAYLERELQVEIHPAHPFFGKRLVLVAHATGNDDVICRHMDQPDRYSIVHLTMSGEAEINDCPTIDCDGSLERVLAYGCPDT